MVGSHTASGQMRHSAVATPADSLLRPSGLERATVVLAADWSRELDAIPPDRRAAREVARAIRTLFMETVRLQIKDFGRCHHPFGSRVSTALV
jgi:hypothetical protein